MFMYVALGDSITAGMAASSPKAAYPALIIRALADHRRGGLGNEVLAQPGWTSDDLRGAVFENSACALAIANAITIWVGGDNLVRAGMAVLGGARRQIVEQAISHYAKDVWLLVTAIRSVSRARIILCTQYNPFPGSSLAETAISTLNQSTIAVANRTGVSVARPDLWFAGRQAALISGYRTGRIEDALSGPPAVHPNDAGHQVIANGLVPLIGTN